MNRTSLTFRAVTSTIVFAAIVVATAGLNRYRQADELQLKTGRARVHYAARHDVSPPLASLRPEVAANFSSPSGGERRPADFVSPPDDDADRSESDQDAQRPDAVAAPAASVPGAAIEQTSQGPLRPAALIDSFDGLGFGFKGPQGTVTARNPSDNSLAAGPNHIVETVNTRVAVYTKKGSRYETTGEVLYGPVPTSTIFKGFGGPCEAMANGDTVVRYDQLAGRWLYVMPIFRRPPAVQGQPPGPYSMCYAVSEGPDPLGSYYRYEFKRELFPDYPRPAIWPDGYYVPTSTGDNVIQKHACVVDRARMLQGLPATEQCVIIDGVNFLNNADIDGSALPPAGAPNIIMATGGTQLKKILEDDGIYVWKFHVDWEAPANTKLSGPAKIDVAPYRYLCGGQLTNCVPQPGTERRLDAQGDKLMQRLVYRNFGGHESIVALHSVDTQAGGGGVRWYEFRLNERRDPYLHQQGTYAPDAFYRWMGSIGLDREGNIGIGYSFGGTPNFPGQRFAARLAGDPPGALSFHETVLVEGGASQTTAMRWEDYSTLAMDPTDDCTFWYVGDYFKPDAPSYTTRIGSFRLPGCLSATVGGASYFDLNHNGRRDPAEPGLAGREVAYVGGHAGKLTTDANGRFSARLPADPAYFEPVYTISEQPPAGPRWEHTANAVGVSYGGAVKPGRGAYTVRLKDRDGVTGLDFGNVCVTRNSGARDVRFWAAGAGVLSLGRRNGEAVLKAHDAAWRKVVNSTLHLVNADGSRFTVSNAAGQGRERFRTWLRNVPERGAAGSNPSHLASVQLATAAMNLNFGGLDRNATILDPVAGDWPAIHTLVKRVSELVAAHPDTTPPGSGRNAVALYQALLEKLNKNAATVTPSTSAGCAPRP